MFNNFPALRFIIKPNISRQVSMTANYTKTMQMFSSSLTNQCYSVVSNSLQESPCGLDHPPLQSIDQNYSLKSTQFYIPEQKRPSTGKQSQSSVYELERRIIDLEEDNFVLRKELVGTSIAPNQTQRKLELESTIKQYEMKLKKQQELHGIQIWRLKEDINNLTQQLHTKPKILVETKNEQPKHCPICSNGEVVTRMKTIIQNLEEQHQHCLKNKKERVVKQINLEGEFQKSKEQVGELVKKLLKMQADIKSIEQQKKQAVEKIKTLEQSIKELNTLKTELGCNNTKIIQQNVQLKLDLMKAKQDVQKIRTQKGANCSTKSETAVTQPPTPSSVYTNNIHKNFLMKSSIIDQLQTQPAQCRRPATMKYQNQPKVLFDIPQNRPPTASFYEKQTIMRQSFEKNKYQRPSSSSKLNTSYCDRSNSDLMARITPNRTKYPERLVPQINLSAPNPNLDTFRPKKYTPAYKYNIN